MSARVAVSIEFFADLSCPWCYAGWAALKQAAARTHERAALSLVWRSFLLAPDAPFEGASREALSAQSAAALQDAARAAGIAFDLTDVDIVPNTLRAHRLVHLAATYGLGERIIDALFDAYFDSGDNIGDASLLVALAEREGLDPQEVAKTLASDDFADLRAMHNAAIKIGVQGAPVAIFNRKAALMGAESVEAYAKAIASVI
jgi:predicted DsbA family dithiol-disulfide isomerase